jgi:hypothetical protein
MVLNVRIGCRAHDMRADIADAERVTIRRGLRRASGANGSAGTDTRQPASGVNVSNGTSRHFAVTQHSGRFWGEADINWQTKPAGSVENDP